jgi:hypothetical protein
MANRRFIDFPIAASVGDNDIVLIWQDGLNKQTTKATLFAGSPNSLAGLTDVDISALANGQILQYNSTTSKWENVDRTDIDLDELGDVTIVSPTNGQVLVYNSSTSKWENSSAGFVPYTGAVTTVNLGAQSILAGSFVKAGGTSAQFLKADGSVDSTAYGTGSVTSVALTMPSAFSVANSPITTAGTLAVTGAGTVAQYVRGDGSLADFPATTGGGASVSYYLNGSVSQGTIGGVAYREFNRNPVFGAGTDISISSDGYIANFITDAGDPNKLLIPAGNWNLETYFSASSSGGSPTFYVELYKYDGSTFTLIASSATSPELIAFGTNLNPYFSTLAVPQTTLALTDRLALRYYVNTSGRTITLHTENDHLCQVITTFTTGLTALNGLTAQVQFFAVGTSGTDFNIASATDTHTFNLPTASATNRGALSSTDWTTFNNKENAITAGTTAQYFRGDKTFQTLNTSVVPEGTNLYYTEARVNANTNVAANTAARHNAVTLGTANGLSLSTQVLSLGLASAGVTGALSGTDWSTFNSKQNALTLTTTGTSGAATLVGSTLNIPNYGSALSGYLPLTGGTLTGPLVGTSISLSGDITANRYRGVNSLVLNSYTTVNPSSNVYLYSPLNDRDAWIYLDSADASSNWGIYHRQIDSAVSGLPANSIGFIGGGSSTLQAWISLANGNGFFAGDLTANNLSGTNTGNVTIGTANGLSLSGQALSLGLASGSANGALSSTDWTTFNNKQNALTNPVTGTGASGRVAFWNGTNTITSDSDLLFSGTTLTLLAGNVEIAAGNGLILFNPATTNYFQLYTNSANELNFGFGGTNPRMTITSSGRLLIGSPPPAESIFSLDVNGGARFTNSTRVEGSFVIQETNTPQQSILLNAIPTNGNTTGILRFGARWNSTTYGTGAEIRASAAGTWSSTNYGSNLTFGTVAQNSDVLTTRLTIASTGAATFSSSVTATKTAKNTYGIQIAGAFYGAPRLQVYDLAADPNGYMGLGTDMSTAPYELSNYFPRTAGLGRWSVGSWAGDFGTGQYVSGYNEKLFITESAAGFNVALTVGPGGLAGRLSVRGTTNDSSAFSFEAANSSGNSLFLVRNDGNVGIGVNPATKFHVEGASVSYGQLRFLNTSSSGEASFNIGRTNQTLEQRWTIGQGVAGIGDSFGFYTGGSSRVNLQTNGNFLIGTTSDSGDRLRVNGTTFSNTIMTWNPANDNRSGVAWRLGAASIGTDILNRRLRVNVGGVEYYIGAVEV